MKHLVSIVLFYLNNLYVKQVVSYECNNVTVDPASRQLLDFKLTHPNPIGVLTTNTGAQIEIRDTVALNSDLLSNQFHLDLMTNMDAERIPERAVHAKGAGAYGYFLVTHDVSKYTKADVFNGIGKKTSVVVRFSQVAQNLGGSDLARETKGMAVKFYTNEGNLDLIGLNIPVYVYKDPIFFASFSHAFKRNPRTNLIDLTSRWDFVTLRPDSLHGFLWVLSDYGIPDGYRKMDVFPIHTYEINNKHGDRYYVRFNFKTEQGLQNLTSAQAAAIGAEDPDYYIRDLYNAIAEKNYPSWKLEMDVLSLRDVKHLDYNPFDVIRLWKRGTYRTVPIGRLILNKNPDNFFKDVEQSAFNPATLVPGIPGPVDIMFKSRRLSYRDTQKHRLGVNHDKIEVNMPKYAKTYSRDGPPPVRENMKDVPNYYPNSFNGPIPVVDESRPKERLLLLETNAVDLEPAAYFYNHVLENDAHRQRLVENTVASLVPVTPPVLKRALRLLTLTDPDFGKRVTIGLEAARAAVNKRTDK